MPRAKKTGGDSQPKSATSSSTKTAKVRDLTNYEALRVPEGMKSKPKEIIIADDVEDNTPMPEETRSALFQASQARSDKALGDLVIGHNSHVAHPEKEGLYIGAITKSPHGFKGRLYAEPYNAEFIRSGAAMYRSHNAILRKRRPDVRFTILHMWQSEQNAA